MSLILICIPKSLGIKMNVTYSQLIQKYMYIHIHREGRKGGRIKGEKNGRKRKME